MSCVHYIPWILNGWCIWVKRYSTYPATLRPTHAMVTSIAALITLPDSHFHPGPWDFSTIINRLPFHQWLRKCGICDDASHFAYGRDLEVESGRPWNIPLINIMKVGNYKAIRDLLLDEGFVDHELVADMENLMSVSGSRGKGRAIALYDIDQPFSVNFSLRHLHVHLNTRSCVRRVELRPFSIRTLGCIHSFFSGKAISIFRWSTKLNRHFQGRLEHVLRFPPRILTRKGACYACAFLKS